MSNLVASLVMLVLIFAWCTHIAWCFANAAWGLLLAGAIFFPIGIGHGIWLWL